MEFSVLELVDVDELVSVSVMVSVWLVSVWLVVDVAEPVAVSHGRSAVFSRCRAVVAPEPVPLPGSTFNGHLMTS